MQPLMVTSLGRTGSTFLMRLLASHPSIVVHRTYPYETRAAGYWMHMLKVLAEPANHSQSSNVGDFHANMFCVGHHPFHSPRTTGNPQLRRWFRETYPEQLAAFCQSSIAAFYEEVASAQGQSHPMFFAEKLQPSYLPWLVWEMYPQAREIVLVRDFRDMLCSIFAFNAKRGYASFRRQDAGSDEEYVRQLGSQAARFYQRWEQRCDKALLLRYEDLILRPVEALTTVMAYLGLEIEPSMIERMLRTASAPDVESEWHQTSAEPLASIGRWRRDLSEALRPVCDEAFGPLLMKLGYEE